MNTTINDFNESTLRDAFDKLSDMNGQLWSLIREVGNRQNGARGDCRCKNETLGKKFKCDKGTISRRFRALRDAGFVVKSDRRMRYSCRRLTDLGRAAMALLEYGFIRAGDLLSELAAKRPPPVFKKPQAPRHAPSHNGTVLNQENNSRSRSLSGGITLRTLLGRTPKAVADPVRWRTHRKSASKLSGSTWESLARWMVSDGRPVSEGRCFVVERRFAKLVHWLSKEESYLRQVFGPVEFQRTINETDRRWGMRCLAERAVRLSIDDAVARNKRFASCESAYGYVGAILKGCYREGRLPGKGVIGRR